MNCMIISFCSLIYSSKKRGIKLNIFGRMENNKYVIGYANKVSLDVFTDSAGYRQPDGSYNSNVGYLIYEGDSLLYKQRKDYINKTNNFGELKAIELALRYIKNNMGDSYDTINIYSDSLLSIKYLTVYLKTWLKNTRDGVMYNSKKEPVKNQDILWNILRLREYFRERNIRIRIYFVRSHSSESMIKNYYELFCRDNNTIITLDEYRIIRERNAICDLYIKD